MADIKSTEDRSRNMAAIKNKDTKPEVFLRKLLFSQGYRYRKNVSYVYGHPDLYMAKYHTAIFVNGCFWHRHHNCKYAYTPKSRPQYWHNKFLNNIKRDVDVKNTLLKEGFKYIIVWECSIKKMQKDEAYKQVCLNSIRKFLDSQSQYIEI